MNNDWVEFNLPYDVYLLMNYPVAPDLSQKFKAEFGEMTDRTFRKKYYNWVITQPEYIEYMEAHDKVVKERDAKLQTMSFCGMGLNVPGTLIEIVNKRGDLEQYLIGHINDCRGTCEDCSAFDSDVIVKRYKVIWSKGQEDANK